MLKYVKDKEMKRIILILVFNFGVISLISQNPTVKFYLKDGSTKQYLIADIDSMNIIKSGDSSNITIVNKKTGSKQIINISKVKKIFFDDSTRIAFELSDSSSKDTTIYVRLQDLDSININTPEQFAYDTVRIANQIWMRKNLNVSRYRNGDTIAHVEDSVKWASLSTGAWCYYNNDPSNEAVYGKLYNWFAASDPRGLAPEGWHVPDYSEWTAMVSYLGDDSLAGGKLKENGTVHWLSPNSGATNESGFTALPGGFRNYDGRFNQISRLGAWWTNEKYDALFAYSRYMRYDDNKAPRLVARFINGFSIRCIKD